MEIYFGNGLKLGHVPIADDTGERPGRKQIIVEYIILLIFSNFQHAFIYWLIY